MFYDQFGRLRPHQIALVSLGVAVLLLGVWVVSAIQPTGQGGVDVGTWVEEDEELEPRDQSSLPGGDHSPEPAEMEPNPLENPFTLPITRTAMLSNPLSPSLPMPPMSPTTRARFRQRGPRYGTLIPELVHPGAPTGFSIGLGAASPGFVLRPGSMSIASSGESSAPASGFGGGRRVRSRSEGVVGIEAIMRGDVRRQGEEGNIQRAEISRELERPVRAETREPREGWWRRLLRRGDGRIRLPEDGEAG